MKTERTQKWIETNDAAKVAYVAIWSAVREIQNVVDATNIALKSALKALNAASEIVEAIGAVEETNNK